MRVSVTIKSRAVKRIRRGHLWIYRSDVQRSEGLSGGEIVTVRDDKGRDWGQALYSGRSQIALRILTRGQETVDAEWWRARLRQSFLRRRDLLETASAVRLVHGEGDSLPSLVIDRYDDVIVLQTLSQGTDALRETFTELIADEFKPRSIVERNDAKVRELEGLALKSGVLFGADPGELEVQQDGVRFLVSPLTGQKTGAFLDQRENQLAAIRWAHGEALDCFTFQGGFALRLAGVCSRVVGLDSSAPALAMARRNAQLNHLSNCHFEEANVFDALRNHCARGDEFDTIVLDPPAFAKNQAALPGARRGYKEINLRAIQLLRPGGILITCTCSYHMSEQGFLEVVQDAAGDAGRPVQLLERRIQGSDHPVLLGVPETLYLKCLVLRVLA